MLPIRRQIITTQYVEIKRANDSAIWSISRDQFLAMLAGMNRSQAIAAVKSSLGEFLEIDPSQLTNKVLFSALATGELSLTIEFGG